MQDDYRLVFIDARGHGKSGAPHDSAAYLTEQRVADVLAVMGAEGIEKVVYYGFSLGGITGFTLAHLHPERLNGVIICGCTHAPGALSRGSLRSRRAPFGRWASGECSRSARASVGRYRPDVGSVSWPWTR